MAVVCPVCRSTSQDSEFCDHCNADLGQPGDALPHAPCPLPGRAVELAPEEREQLKRPEAWVRLRDQGTSWRIHWIARRHLPRWLPRVKERQSFSLACLAPCQVVEEAKGAWILVEAGGEDFAPWNEPAQPNAAAEVERMLESLDALTAALETLHAAGLVWPNFDPKALERTANGTLRITNLDLTVHHAGALPDSLPIRTAFAAPEITRLVEKNIGPQSDVYHLALFAYYWLARILPDGFSGAGLDAFGHLLPPLRIFRPDLPIGVAAVLHRGLALEAADRWPQPRDLLDALGEAVRRYTSRAAFEGSLRWEIGSHTRAGRTKTAQARGNEDNVVVRPFVEPARALLAVTDGITTCDVGSGALASLITSIVLENSFSAADDAAGFANKITDVCCRAAQNLVDWAMEKGYGDQLLGGADLMGTTLTAAWLEGRSLSVANVGDSRVYLIDGADVEQLTVDGDLGSGLLASGTPPEEIREIGLVAKALRECIGGCTVTPEGNITLLDESCHPAHSRWPLLPGDVVILCSDGLVEEGAFLDPGTLADLVRKNRHLAADKLAIVLADAADALQRLPSALEPEGVGDNITCIVVKIEPA